MFRVLPDLQSQDLSRLATLIETGRLEAEGAVISLANAGFGSHSKEIAADLEALSTGGELRRVIPALRALAARGINTRQEQTDLVWTGPESRVLLNRDTSAVVAELFKRAQSEIIIAGFVVYQGESILRPLADQLNSNPNLAAMLLLNVKFSSTRENISSAVQRFTKQFWSQQWPGGRRPLLYLYANDQDEREQSALHAKCIVVDNHISFVSSANFTEAAQERNIEVGAVIKEREFSEVLAAHLRNLILTNVVVPAT